MVFAFATWILLSLVAISFVGSYPHAVLGMCALGGVVLGLYLCRLSNGRPSNAVAHLPGGRGKTLPIATWIHKRELFLQIFPFLILFFSNRLPLLLSFCALLTIILLWICRKKVLGFFTVGSPVDLPILFLLLCSIPSLYASVDLGASVAELLALIACIAFFYGVFNGVDSDKKLQIALLVFTGVGIGVVLCASLVMQFSPAKLPLVPGLYNLLPDALPRRIHFNYIGGALTLFFPLAFWSFVLRYWQHKTWYVTAGAILGLGLLATQSRGALLGSVVALGVTGALLNRWVRWGFPGLIVGGGALLYVIGGEALLERVGGSGAVWGRVELWEQAIHIIQDFPFTGIGMRTFPLLTDSLYPVFLGAPNTPGTHVHNLYLQVTVDIGIPGFIAFCALLGAWGGMVWEVLVLSRSMEGGWPYEIPALGLAGGGLAHMVYSLTDAITLGDKAGGVFWGVLGLSAVLWQRVRSEAA